LAAVAAISA